MNKILLFTIGLFIAACTPMSDEKSKDSAFNKTDLKSTTSDDKLENKLMGIWTDGSTENASFDIRKDSIFYVEQLEAYKYELISDSIHIHYPDFKYLGKVTFKGDSLILSSEDGEFKYWHFKN